MTASLKFMWGLTVTASGRREQVPFGSIDAPVKEVIIPDTFKLLDSIVLPKMTGAPAVGVPVQIWDWTRSTDFQAMVLQFRDGEGYGCLSTLLDAPVSDSDLTPQSEQAVPVTTYRRVGHVEFSCFTPLVLNSCLARVHATLATAVGLDANGKPKLMTDAATVPGRLCRAWVTNLSTDSDAILDLYVRE